MVIVREKKQKLAEGVDTNLSDLSFKLSQYLTTRGLKGRRIPDTNANARKVHAQQYYLGMKEVVEALADYTEGYRKSMAKDAVTIQGDNGLAIYDKVIKALRSI